MNYLKSLAAGIVALQLVLICGCSDSGGRLTVSGMVTFDGKPLEKGTVGFTDQTGANFAIGKITKNGSFTMEQVEGKGVIPGNYGVKVESWNEAPGTLLPNGGFAKGDSIIPMKYNNAKTSGLTAEVTPKNTKFDFKLLKE